MVEISFLTEIKLKVFSSELNEESNHLIKRLNNSKEKYLNHLIDKFHDIINSKIYLYIVFLIILSLPIKSDENNSRLNLISNLNIITLKIRGTGPQYVLNPNSVNICPTSIYLNNQRINIMNPNAYYCLIVNIPSGGSIVNNIKLEFNNVLFQGLGRMLMT